MRINRRGHELVLNFKTHADLLVIRGVVARWDGSEDYGHIQTFTPPDDAYQRTWTMWACRFLNEAGIAYQSKQRHGEVELVFSSFAALLMFGELEQAGFFNRLTETTIQTDGPAPPAEA